MKSCATYPGSSPLATPLELTQLAVQIHIASGLTKPPEHCVSSVFSMLLQARSKLDQIANTQKLTEDAQRKADLLRGSLKIGKHILPAFTKMPTRFGDDGKTLITLLEDFAQLAVGLSKDGDRKRWLRAFLRERIKARREIERTSAIDGDKASIPTIPTDVEIERETENILSRWRKEGIQDAEELALDYRAWRLTKDSPERPASPPHNLEECSKLALGPLLESKI